MCPVPSLDSMGSYCVHVSMIITGAQVEHEANGSFPNQWLLLCSVSNVLVVCTTKHRYIHYSGSNILVADLCVECIKNHLLLSMQFQ